MRSYKNICTCPNNFYKMNYYYRKIKVLINTIMINCNYVIKTRKLQDVSLFEVLKLSFALCIN